MSISTEITRLQNAKASIKSSIEGKGVTVPSSTKLEGYSTLIDTIETGPSIESLNVTANGTYRESGKAYSPVIVNVPNSYSASDEGKVVDNGSLVSQTSQSISVNGTYDTTLKNEVVVDVPTGITPSGTLSVTANGTYDVTNYASADVSVSGDFETGTIVGNGSSAQRSVNVSKKYTHFAIWATGAVTTVNHALALFQNASVPVYYCWAYNSTTRSGYAKVSNSVYVIFSNSTIKFQFQTEGTYRATTNGVDYEWIAW